jgi:Tetratricopeptide repeat.
VDVIIYSEKWPHSRRPAYLAQLKEWNEFLKKYPRSIEGHLGRGQTLHRLGSTPEARKDFERALQLDPNSKSVVELLQNTNH